MNDLNALFDSVDGLKEDLIEYGTIAAGAIGANVVWNVAVAKFGGVVPAGPMRTYGLPAAAILLGIFGGRMVARKNRKLGLGFTIGLVTAGLTSYVKMFAPSIPGLAGDDYYGVAGYLGAPVTVEDGISGAMSIEETGVAGFGAAQVEEMSGFESVLQ